MTKQWIYSSTILLMISCSASGNEQRQIWKQAAAIHNEMVRKAALLEERLAGINSDTVAISPDSVIAWKNEIRQWEQELVEVPGNEASHSHAGKHHHHDHQPLAVTPGQMLIIQEDFKNRLQSIEDRIESALSTIDKSF